MKLTALASLFLVAAFTGQGLTASDRPRPATVANDVSDHQSRLALLVPAYFYPGDQDRNWGALRAAASQVPLTAVVNPVNGPGVAADPQYQQAISALQSAGGKVIAYIHTRYGSRDIRQVQSDVERYISFYPTIDGFFIDEMTNTGETESLVYYGAVYDYIKQRGSRFQVIGNPGTTTDASYLNWRAADVVINFEGSAQRYTRHKQRSAMNAAHRQGHLVYQSSDTATMRRVLGRAVQLKAGLVYVTNDRLDNPWDTLPSYWPEAVSCVRNINSGAGYC